jgi:hypothetical protein
MKKLSYSILLVVFIFVLSGCEANSGVVPMGQGTYMVSRQAATGFTGSGTLKAKALREANDFCENQGKCLKVIRVIEARPPYIFTNFPKAEVNFMCLDPNDPRLKEDVSEGTN